jgi:hydroxyacylglutathione hydrolase
MIIDTIVVGSYQVNCYITGDSESNEVIVIDPGFNGSQIIALIESKKYKPVGIVLTHGHGDHIGAVLEIKEKYDIPLYMHKFDLEMVTDTEKNFSKWILGEKASLTPDVYLSDGDIINVGAQKFEVIHTPGHTPGGICLKGEHALFTGDTLFRESIGRTDLPGGSSEQLIHSIKTKLIDYPEDTKIFPGHSLSSTIAHEKIYNYFLRS